MGDPGVWVSSVPEDLVYEYQMLVQGRGHSVGEWMRLRNGAQRQAREAPGENPGRAVIDSTTIIVTVVYSIVFQ